MQGQEYLGKTGDKKRGLEQLRDDLRPAGWDLDCSGPNRNDPAV